MTSKALKAYDLLTNLSEEYQFYDKHFLWKTDKELKTARFRLLLNIIFNEYSNAIHDNSNANVKVEDHEQSLFETSCTDEELLAASSTSGIKQNGDQKGVNDALPAPFKLDEYSLDYIPDTCFKPHEFVLPKGPQIPKSQNTFSQINDIDMNRIKSEKLSPIPTHNEEKNISLQMATPQNTPKSNVLVDNSSGGSSNGSPSILSRRKKKRTNKHSIKLESEVSIPPSPKENNHRVGNVKDSITSKPLGNTLKKSLQKYISDKTIISSHFSTFLVFNLRFLEIFSHKY